MSELKACPFCGSKAIAYDDKEDCIASCTNQECHAMPCVVGCDTVEEAIAKWNRRPAQGEQTAGGWVSVPREHLQDALNYIKHCGANAIMRGQPHPQQQIVDWLETALAAAPAEGGERCPDCGSPDECKPGCPSRLP